jgi:hypothetical protein
MIETTLGSLSERDLQQSKGSIGLFCLSCVSSVSGQPTLTTEQILEHVHSVQKLGHSVLVFHERELYKMGAFVNRFTKSRVHFAVELSALVRALQDNYQDLDGVLLEGVARLFRENVRLSVFPVPTQALEEGSAPVGWKWKATNGLVGARDIEPAEPLNHLYRYLVGSGFILPNELAST